MSQEIYHFEPSGTGAAGFALKRRDVAVYTCAPCSINVSDGALIT